MTLLLTDNSILGGVAWALRMQLERAAAAAATGRRKEYFMRRMMVKKSIRWGEARDCKTPVATGSRSYGKNRVEHAGWQAESGGAFPRLILPWTGRPPTLALFFYMSVNEQPIERLISNKVDRGSSAFRKAGKADRG
jgi:hypothetical protein